MAKKRRDTVNLTGISRLENIPYHDAWVAFPCLSCKEMNYVNIGQELLSPSDAYENAVWTCHHCGYIHSKDTDLPFEHWDDKHKDSEFLPSQRFWLGFFRSLTEHAESYWKQCNCCGRILPFASFSKHSKWGPLERQMECRACKGAINAELNPKRTAEQLHESSIRRRIADLMVADQNETIDIEDLFSRFEGKCFKTNTPLKIEERNSWDIDHIMPSLYLWPLTKENAALLSRGANNSKKAKWPSKFYTNSELIRLATITGANLELLSSKEPIINQNIDVNKGVERYLTVREGSNLQKRIAEIKKILIDYKLVDQLSDEYKKLLGF